MPFFGFNLDFSPYLVSSIWKYFSLLKENIDTRFMESL